MIKKYFAVLDINSKVHTLYYSPRLGSAISCRGFLFVIKLMHEKTPIPGGLVTFGILSLLYK